MRIPLVVAAVLAAAPAQAQVFGGTMDLIAPNGASSAATLLPVALSSSPAVVLVMAAGSTGEVRFKVGNSTVSITGSTGQVILPGVDWCFNPGPYNYIALWGVSAAVTVHISQWTSCPDPKG